MNVKINLWSDFQKIIFNDIQELKNYGFKFLSFTEWDKSNTNKQTLDERYDAYHDYLLIRYLGLKCLLPHRQSYKVISHSDFKCPPEEKHKFNEFVKKAKKGECLWPHMSCGILEKKPDFMHLDWNIYHFHLGIDPKKNMPNFVERGDKILYAFLMNDTIYPLVIDSHGRWEDSKLLEIIKKHWPEHLENRKIDTQSMAYIPTEKDLKKLRKAHINSAVQIDGDFYSNLGAGITLAGTNASAMRMRNLSYRNLSKIQRYLCDNASFLFVGKMKKMVDLEISLIYVSQRYLAFECNDATFDLLFDAHEGLFMCRKLDLWNGDLTYELLNTFKSIPIEMSCEVSWHWFLNPLVLKKNS